jgi:hypothetical protein
VMDRKIETWPNTLLFGLVVQVDAEV